jgi:hypothetical protein
MRQVPLALVALALAGLAPVGAAAFNPIPRPPPGGVTSVCADDTTTRCCAAEFSCDDPAEVPVTSCASHTCSGDPADLASAVSVRGTLTLITDEDVTGWNGPATGYTRDAENARLTLLIQYERNGVLQTFAETYQLDSDGCLLENVGDPALCLPDFLWNQPASEDHRSPAQHRLHRPRRCGGPGGRRRAHRQPEHHGPAVPRHHRPPPRDDVQPQRLGPGRVGAAAQGHDPAGAVRERRMSERARLPRSAALAAALLAAGGAGAEPAEPVALSGPLAAVEGTLAPLDVDVYTISVAAGARLFVGLFDERDGAFLDTRLAIRQGAVLASDDDGGDGFLSRLAIEASAGGSYEIVVSGFRDEDLAGAHAEGAPGEAPYRLVVAVAGPAGSESEPNDAAADADPIAAGGGVVLGRLDPLDVDRYALPVGAGDTVAAALFELAAGGGAPLANGGELADSRLGLFAGASTPFAEDDDGGPGLLSNLARSAPSGASSVELAVTGFRDAGYAGVHPEGPFDYALVVATFATAAVPRCDVVALLGQIDRDDIDAIVAARNQPASGPTDPRDADGNGTITVIDASLCRTQCRYPRCARSAPVSSCGLLGIEPLGALALLELARRRRARRRLEEV